MNNYSTKDEENRLEDLKKTARWLLFAATLGALLIVFRYVFSAYQNNVWIVRGNAFTCLLWGSGSFMAAFVIGFLFGIPKVLQTTPKTTAADNKSSADDGGGGAVSGRPFPLKVNTNLEEISDWLTKILVGATLTQLIKMPGLIKSAAAYMAPGIGGPGYEAVAGATLLYFAALGFFAGYVLTRMFFSLAFARADTAPRLPDISDLRQTSIALGAPVDRPKEVEDSIERLESIPLTSSLTTSQILGVAKAANIVGNIPRAVQAARLAVERSANDPEAHLNLAVALHKADQPESEVMQELTRARVLVDLSRNPRITEDIYNSIIYLALYLDPPGGFERAIQDGEQFLRANSPTDSAIWMNLACAYAQQYSYYSETQKTPEGQEEARKVMANARTSALKYIRLALQRYFSSIDRFRELFHGTGPDPEGDDLKVFEKDPEFVELIDGKG